jgi:hypothetical protein
MRITLNLSPAASARDRYALTWAIPATVVGLVALILLSRGSLRENREYQAVRAQLAVVQSRTDDLHNQEAAIRRKLEDPQYRELLHRSQFLNKLIGQRQLSLSQMAARLAGLLPEDARLTGLALTSPKKSGDDYTVRMGITAKNEDAIETFLNDLEDAPDFRDVSITNQGFQEDSSQPEQVNIICSASYLPGADITTEKTSAEEPAPNRKSNR